MHNQNSKSFLIRDLLGDLINRQQQQQHQQQQQDEGKLSKFLQTGLRNSSIPN